MNELKFECPRCRQHLACDEKFSGRQFKCPGCNHIINVPPIPGKTAEYEKESGLTWATHVAPPEIKPPE